MKKLYLIVLLVVLIVIVGCQPVQQPTFEERRKVNKLKVIKYFHMIAEHDRKVREYLNKNDNRNILPSH